MSNTQAKFIQNWNNKLDCEFFTTVRRYRFDPNKDVDIILNGVYKKTCFIYQTWEGLFKDLPDEIKCLDVGQPAPDNDVIFHRLGFQSDTHTFVYLLKSYS